MTHLTLHEEIYKTRIEYQKMKAERDTLIDDIAVLKANLQRQERLNAQLKIYRSNWDKLREWRLSMLEIKPADQSLLGLGHVMYEYEQRLYKKMERD